MMLSRAVLFAIVLGACSAQEAVSLGETSDEVCGSDEVLDYCATTSMAPCNALTDHSSCISGTLPYASNGHLVDPVIIRLYPNFPSGKPAQDPVWEALANASAFWSRLGFYGVGTGVNGGWHVLANWLPPANGKNEFVSDCELETRLAQGGIPDVPTNLGDGTHGTTAVIFVIYMPPFYCPAWWGTKTCPINEGYHSSFIAGGKLYNYAVISPTATIADSESTSSHEIAEAATDFDIEDCPVSGGASGCGWNTSNTEGEVADLCGTTENMGGFTIAKVLDMTCGTCE